MSRSESDDDEFESADEGDEATDESCNEEECTSNGIIPVVQTEPTTKKEEVLKEIVQENPVSGHTLTKVVDHAEIPEIPVHGAEEFLHHKELQDVITTSVEDLVIHDCVVPHPDNISDQIPTLDTPRDVEACQEDQTFELPGSGATVDDTDYLPTTVNETIIPAEPFCEDAKMPPHTEIENKISATRNVSNRGKVRSKPTLGAKKLGAVKLSQPHESPSPALAKIDSKEISREAVTSTAQEVVPVTRFETSFNKIMSFYRVAQLTMRVEAMMDGVGLLHPSRWCRLWPH